MFGNIIKACFDIRIQPNEIEFQSYCFRFFSIDNISAFEWLGATIWIIRTLNGSIQ